MDSVEELRNKIVELEADLLSAKHDYAGAMAELDHFESLASDREHVVEFLECQNDKLVDSIEDVQDERDELKTELESCQSALREVIEHFDNFFYQAGLNVMHDAKKIVSDYDVDI